MSYPPAPFLVSEPAEVDALLAGAGLGTLVAHTQAFSVSHLPFAYEPEARVLRGHLSRRNPQTLVGEVDALVLFEGADAYVSPNLYPSKARHGRVAPTWNFERIRVFGRLRWIDDPAWLRRNLDELTERLERDEASPWRVADAPGDFTAKLIPLIVGLELAIERIEAVRKMSQGSKDEDRDGVIAAFAASGDPARERIARLIEPGAPRT